MTWLGWFTQGKQQNKLSASHKVGPKPIVIFLELWGPEINGQKQMGNLAFNFHPTCAG